MGTKRGLCALVNDSITQQAIALDPEKLMKKPPDGVPRARRPAPRDKKR
jgi:hypothetical protein